MLWDPVRAEEAERKGEDIAGYLDGDMDLQTKELLMKVLHANDYDVEASRIDKARLTRWHGNRKYEFKNGENEDDYCFKCDDGGELIVCDGCRRGAHLECLDPPLQTPPDGDWYCPFCTECLSKNGGLSRRSTNNAEVVSHDESFND
jgi:hypothetical protein